MKAFKTFFKDSSILNMFKFERKKDQYKQLGVGEIATRSTASWMPRRPLGLLFATLAILFLPAAMLAVGLKDLALAMPSGTMYGDCGHNATTASGNGCRFDIWLHTWMPSGCFDGALMEESLQRDWHFQIYRDFNLTVTVPLDEVLQGAHHKFYTTPDFHAFHCYYIWKKQARVLLKESKVDLDGRISEYEHVEHCTETARYSWVAGSPNITFLPVMFRRCVVP